MIYTRLSPFPILLTTAVTSFHRTLTPCHITIARVNDVMKFKSLYSLVHIPSCGARIIIELSLSLGRLSAGHLYLRTKRFT